MRMVWPGSVVACALIAFCSMSVRAEDSPASDPRKPPAITTENVPLVPGDLVERLNQYQNVRVAGFAGWAPDGRGILISTRFGNASQLHAIYEPGGRREQLTFFEEPVGGGFIPGRSDRALLVTMSRGGDENYQVLFLDHETGKATLLTDGSSRNNLGPVRDDGSRMVIHSNRRNGRDTDMYLASCQKPDTMELALPTDGEYWVAADWAPDGSQLSMFQYVSINESYPALFQVADKKLEAMPAAAEGKVAYQGGAFARDGRSLYLASDAPGEFLQLARYDLKSRQYQWLADELAWDVESIEVDPTTGVVAFTVNEDGSDVLYLLAGDTPRRLETPLGMLSGLEFSPDGSQLGFTLSPPDGPSDAWSIRLADGEMTRWSYSEVGGLNPERFVTPQKIRFKSFDEREIPAYYFKPVAASSQAPVPVLIQIHGGPEGQYRPYFSGLTQFFVGEMGMAVIAPNVRGSAGYGKSYLQLDNGPLREDSVRDIGALLDWIAQQPELDASRVAVTGGSYGGYMVLASLVHFGDRLRAGIDNVGIANFITFLENTSPYRQDLRRAEYGDERDPEMRAVFERINPSANAEKIRSALLVAHGTNDPRVPFSEAQQIVSKVRGAGRPVWSVYADNEGHGFAKKDNRDYLTAVEVLFLQEHLLGE